MNNYVEKVVSENLKNNIDLVIKLLSRFSHSIKPNSEKTSLRFDIIGHSSCAYSMKLSTLTYYNFRTNEKGHLLSLLSEYYEMNIKELANKLYIYLLNNNLLEGCDFENEYEEDVFVFQKPPTYLKEDFSHCEPILSELFLSDGIFPSTQKKFDIRYSKELRRIVIPVYYNKELVGAIGRRNSILLQEWENKYFPILSYRKSLVLFGYDEFYDLIQKTKKVVLVESEKSVMKMWQMETKLPTLALGGNSLSRNQIELLKILQVDTVIFALDKGLPYENGLYKNVNLLKRYGRECNIKFINVNETTEEELADKECICDRSKEEITKLFEKYLENI